MARTDGIDVQTAIARTEGEARPKTLADYVNGLKPEIARALPAHVDPDRIARIAITALRTNRALQESDPQTFLAALMQAAQFGLEPNTPLGEAFLIPYKNKHTGRFEVQFQIGYKGILALAYRTGEYQTIYAREVYANDKFSYQYGLNPDLVHVPADNPEGEPVYYYAVYKLKNGGSDFVVWHRDKMEAHAKRYSQALRSGKDTPWKTNFGPMALKTMVKQVLNYAPKSIEFTRQLSADETVKRAVADDMTEIPGESIEMPSEYVYEAQEEDQEDNADPKAMEQETPIAQPAPAIPGERPATGAPYLPGDDEAPMF